MKNKMNRRKFIIQSSVTCAAGCALLTGSKVLSTSGMLKLLQDDEIPDPKKLNYCGYVCPEDCQMLTASIKNDPELKKEAYKVWRIKEKYNIDFDPEKIYCFKCKNDSNTEGIIIENCTVRKCAREKGFDCCIECNELEACSKEIWETFPDFKKSVIQMQIKYNKSI